MLSVCLTEEATDYFGVPVPPHSSVIVGINDLFNFSGCVVMLICISLITVGGEHLFMSLFALYVR